MSRGIEMDLASSRVDLAVVRLHCAWWLAALAAACGPQLGSETSNGESTGTSSTTTGMADVSTSAPACEGDSLLGDDPGMDLELRFTNATADTVWVLRWSCERFGFWITGANGEAITVGPSCENLCNAVLEGECDFWCEDHCDAILVRVQPQASYTATWDRRMWETADVPGACSSCTPECVRPVRLPSGTYTASILVFGGCLYMGQECTCSDPGNGNCEAFLGSPQGDPTELSTAFDPVADSTVQLVLN